MGDGPGGFAERERETDRQTKREKENMNCEGFPKKFWLEKRFGLWVLRERGAGQPGRGQCPARVSGLPAEEMLWSPELPVGSE